MADQKKSDEFKNTCDEWTTETVMDTAFWEKTWSEDGAKNFHLPYLAGWFLKYADTLLGGKKNAKVLVPFCGKDVAMKWLLEHGHRVVGIECAEQGCKEFFNEQNIDYSVEKTDKFTIYKSATGNLKLYCGDFFKFSSSSEGKFDAIWDRGALNTVNSSQRKEYVDLMTSVINPDAVWIIILMDSKDKKIVEEWDILTDEKLKVLFGDRFKLELSVEYDTCESQNLGLDMAEMEGIDEKLCIARPQPHYLTGTFLDADYWTNSWSQGEGKFFTLPRANPWLMKYEERLFGASAHAHVLVPFCGKDPTMKWLAEKGHSVVGVEWVEQACTEFFTEHQIQYTCKKHGAFTLYQNSTGTLKLYCGDFLKFTADHEGKFDVVFDRGAMNAVNLSQREQYVSTMRSLCAPAARWMLLCFHMDDPAEAEKFECISDELLTKLLADGFKADIHVECVDAAAMNEGIDMSDMGGLQEKLSIILRK